MNADDAQLLRQYSRDGSEEAFAELVHRHLDLVWAAAWRISRDAELARDIAQGVFADLARKARVLPPQTVLAGWLYRAACLAATKAVRSNSRRARREREAMLDQSTGDHTPDDDENFQALLPVLDEALGQLGDFDRHAIVLRFFARKSFAEIGTALGLSDDTAQKRLSRALDKLRRHFQRRGHAVSAGALLSALGLAGAQAAPAGLANALAMSSLAGATAAAGGSNLISTLLAIPTQIVAMKTQVAVGALALVTVSTPLVWQQHRLDQVRAEREALLAQTAGLDELRQRHAALLKVQYTVDELETLRRFQRELFDLQRESAQLSQASLDERLQLHQEWQTAQGARSLAQARAAQVQMEAQFQQSEEEAINTMKHLGLAARIWAQDSDGYYPPSFLSMTNEMLGYVITDLEARYEFVPHGLPIRGEFRETQQTARMLDSSALSRVLLFREREPRLTPDGQWTRAYAKADGAVLTKTFSNPTQFDEWEQEFMVATP